MALALLISCAGLSGAAAAPRLLLLSNTQNEGLGPLDHAMAAINTELEGIATDRTATTQSVSAEFLALYEKIRGADGGIGAAVLAGNQCKGCHLILNANELQRITGLADDEVIRCEECRCILVRGL